MLQICQGENEFHTITLSGTIEVLVLASGLLTPFCNLIGRSTHLELTQGFGLVTPDPLSSHELGGVWACDYRGSRQKGGFHRRKSALWPVCISEHFGSRP